MKNALRNIIIITSAHISSSLAKGYDSGPPSLHPWRILEYILKFAGNATWWLIEVAPLR